MRKIVLVSSFMLLAFALVGCQATPKNSQATSATSTESTHLSSSAPAKTEQTTQSSATQHTSTSSKETATNTEPSRSSEATNPSDQQTPTPVPEPPLTSVEEALAFLHGKLASSDDIEYLPWGEGEDGTRSYFDFKLTSKEIRKNGGSGTVAIYRVYDDQTYELYPEE